MAFPINHLPLLASVVKAIGIFRSHDCNRGEDTCAVEMCAVDPMGFIL